MYNQRDYPHIPYPAKGYERATVKTSGCGPVGMSMVVETLTGQAFPPEESVAAAIACGARVPGGTDLAALCRAVGQRFGLTWRTSNDIGQVLRAVGGGAARRGMAIANVGGDRQGYTGLFSSGGHYVVVAGVDAGLLCVLDPNLYPGKFDVAGRRGRVARQEGALIFVKPEELERDVQTRPVRYYILEKKQ